MTEKLTSEEIAALDKGQCPDCTNTKFLDGPRGGFSQNIKCAWCGAKFNVVPGVPGKFGKHRI